MNFLRDLIRFVTFRLMWIKSLGRLFMLDKLGRKISGKRVPGAPAGMSLPAKAALLTLVLLVICVAVWFITLRGRTGLGPIDVITDWRYVTVIVLLVVAIPIVVYKTVQVWLEGEGALFLDIEAAWLAGLDELARQNIDLHHTPLLFVVGCQNEEQGQALFASSPFELAVRNVPQGAAPLHWYASSEAVFLVCTDVGAVSLVAHLTARLMDSAPAAEEGESAGADWARQTLVPGGHGPSGAAAAEQPSAPAAARHDIRGTMDVAQLRETIVPHAADAPQQAKAPSRFAVAASDRQLQQARLEFLCRRIVRARKPHCAINGMLVLMPYRALELEASTAELTVACSTDLRAATDILQLRFPVNVLVTGLEDEPGFQELVRRIGPAEAAAGRFGRGHDVWKTPIPEQMEALSAHACGAFEDWAYRLFREKDALRRRRGNEQLYSLLCKIRGQVRLNLQRVLVDALGHDPERDAAAEPPLFGGCYFAATGRRDDRRAFIRSVVFDKLLQHEGDVEWTDHALYEDDRDRRTARLLIAFDVVAAVVLAGAIYIAVWG